MIGDPAAHVAIGATWGLWIFAGFAFAFLIKTPVFPFHTWMPDTYAELPPPSSPSSRRCSRRPGCTVSSRSRCRSSRAQMVQARTADVRARRDRAGLRRARRARRARREARRRVQLALAPRPDRAGDLQRVAARAAPARSCTSSRTGCSAPRCSSRSARSRRAKRRATSRGSAVSARATRSSPAR